jgi:uncharacterized membrane protein (UPF0127 family)
MKVHNSTKKTVVSATVLRADSTADRMLGLLRFDHPHALLIHTRFGIHTFGLKFPIDVLILDKENTVAALNKNMKPNRIFIWNPTWDTVLELPGGSIEKSKSEIGDTLKIDG